MPLSIVDASSRFVWNRGKDAALRAGLPAARRQAEHVPGGGMRRETRPAVWLLRDAQAQHQLEVLETCVQLGELAFQAQPVANLQLIGCSA